MGTARDHCCYCQMEAPSSSPTLTNQPTTATRAPTLPNSTPTMDDDFMQWYSQFGGTSEPPCEGNTPGWVDSVGDGCSWYEMFDAPGCPEEGDLYTGPMGTARENCCYCWMDAPTLAPTVSSSPTLTPAPTAPVICQGSTPNFKDSFGDGCDWYESSDEPGCPHHGHHYEGAMGVANDHCCYCKMSSSPTQTPPDIAESTTESQESTATETPAEAVSGLWGSLFGG